MLLKFSGLAFSYFFQIRRDGKNKNPKNKKTKNIKQKTKNKNET